MSQAINADNINTVLLYEVPEIIKIFYDKNNELIIHEWFEYNPEDKDHIILEVLQIIYEQFLKYPVKKIIVKTDKTKGIFSLNIQKYIKNVQFPRLLADTNLSYIVTIKSDIEMDKIGTLIWQNLFEKGTQIILHDVRTEKEARSWLKDIESDSKHQVNT